VFQQLLLFTLLVPESVAKEVPDACRCSVPGALGYAAVVIGATNMYHWTSAQAVAQYFVKSNTCLLVAHQRMHTQPAAKPKMHPTPCYFHRVAAR
jgi:hypothetical protein